MEVHIRSDRLVVKYELEDSMVQKGYVYPSEDIILFSKISYIRIKETDQHIVFHFDRKEGLVLHYDDSSKFIKLDEIVTPPPVGQTSFSIYPDSDEGKMVVYRSSEMSKDSFFNYLKFEAKYGR